MRMSANCSVRLAPGRAWSGAGGPGRYSGSAPTHQPARHRLSRNSGVGHQPLYCRTRRHATLCRRRPHDPLNRQSNTMTKPITYDCSWKEKYQSSVATAEEAVKRIRPGQRIFIGTGVAEPLELVSALSKRALNCRIPRSCTC